MNTQGERGRIDNEFFPNFSRSIECGAGDGGRERVRERKIESEKMRDRDKERERERERERNSHVVQNIYKRFQYFLKRKERVILLWLILPVFRVVMSEACGHLFP